MGIRTSSQVQATRASTTAPPCIVCASRDHRYLYDWSDGVGLFQCRACRLVFTHPLPDRYVLEAYYDDVSREEIEASESFLPPIRRALEEYFRIIRNLRGRTEIQTYLDVGGGGGLYARAAELLGCDVTYVDIDAASLSAARHSLRSARLIKGDIERIDEIVDDQYDVIMARHTIEHLPDPNRFLAGLRACLKPGGILIIETPNMGNWEQWAHLAIAKFVWPTISRANPHASIWKRTWWTLSKPFSGINPPKHLYGFDAQNLKQLLHKHGFRIRWQRITIFGDPTFDPLYYRKTAFAKRGLVGKLYYPYQRVVSAVIGRLNRGSLLVAFVGKA